MPIPCTAAAPPLLNEHLVLCRVYAQVQERCSRQMAAQRAELVQLQAEVLRLRARALVLTTALAWQRADHVALRPAVAPVAPESAASLPQAARAPCPRAPLESSLIEANLVICQVGCLSHGAYWRDAYDQCRRSGQTCVMVESVSAMQAPASPWVNTPA